VAYHNNTAEFSEVGTGAHPLDIVFENAPDLSLQIDIAWIYRAGANPLEVLNRYSKRIRSAHLRDIAAPGQAREEGGWADVGHGVMNWQKLWPLLESVTHKRRFVEHSNPSDHWRFARRSLEAIRSFEGSTVPQ
jgi:sugar phosphate isomerase/epimerase